LSVASRSIICDTLTNHDILLQPSPVVVLSFDDQVCFHIFKNRSLTPQEGICHFTRRSMVTITHEQNLAAKHI